jgi:hypothetical protein
MSQVKRICVLFPDGSILAMSNEDGELAAANRARQRKLLYNKGETDPQKLAMFGEIQIDLMSFKERF